MWVERNGPTYRIRDQVGDRKVTIESGLPTKRAATTRMAVLTADRVRGDELVPRGAQMTLSAWVEIWRPGWEASLKPTARHSEGGRLRNHVLPLLGHLPLGDILPLTVQAWVADLVAGRGPVPPAFPGRRRMLAPKTVHSCHGLLWQIMQAAVTGRLIRHNPCVGTILPRRVHHEMRFLTEPEIARLLSAIPEHWRPLVLTLVTTGLRWGEAVGLSVGAVDVLARPPRVRVERTLQEMSSTAEITFTDPKTKQSRRTVTLTTQTALALVPLVGTRGRDELLFRAPKGGPARSRAFRRVWRAATARAGLDGLRVHDLRHTHAAILISAGRPLTAVQRRLGHSSIVVTSDLYGHLMPEVDEGILSAIDAAMTGVDLETLDGEIADEVAAVV